MKKPLNFAKTLAALLVCVSFASGASPVVAQVVDVAAQLADGNPWNARTPDGQSMTLTLNKDGTAKMSFGFLGRDLNWTATADGLCLDGMPTGRKCMSLVAIEGGFAAVENGKSGLTLTRP
jgi:hypothetical protein